MYYLIKQLTEGAHGASIATVYDEILAYPVWRTNTGSFTAELIISYKRMTPLNEWIKFDAYIDRIEGRKIYMTGKLYDGNDNSIVYNTGKGLWIQSKLLTSIGQDKHSSNKQQALHRSYDTYKKQNSNNTNIQSQL